MNDKEAMASMKKHGFVMYHYSAMTTTGQFSGLLAGVKIEAFSDYEMLLESLEDAIGHKRSEFAVTSLTIVG